jgi:hypothetical protein
MQYLSWSHLSEQGKGKVNGEGTRTVGYYGSLMIETTRGKRGHREYVITLFLDSTYRPPAEM